jgi:hypothetical protein
MLSPPHYPRSSYPSRVQPKPASTPLKIFSPPLDNINQALQPITIKKQITLMKYLTFTAFFYLYTAFSFAQASVNNFRFERQMDSSKFATQEAVADFVCIISEIRRYRNYMICDDPISYEYYIAIDSCCYIPYRNNKEFCIFSGDSQNFSDSLRQMKKKLISADLRDLYNKIKYKDAKPIVCFKEYTAFKRVVVLKIKIKYQLLPQSICDGQFCYRAVLSNPNNTLLIKSIDDDIKFSAEIPNVFKEKLGMKKMNLREQIREKLHCLWAIVPTFK